VSLAGCIGWRPGKASEGEPRLAVATVPNTNRSSVAVRLARFGHLEGFVV
jgi:hypothetical protein